METEPQALVLTSTGVGQREWAQWLYWLTGFHLLWQVGAYSGQMGRSMAHEVLESKFISRLGDCSSGPQWLIYICTWNWLNESSYTIEEVNKCGTCAVSMPSLPVRRWPGQRMFHVATHGSVLIELSHGLSSSGYVYDSVPPGRAMVECDIH